MVQPIVAIYKHVRTHSLYIVSMYLYLIAFHTISVSRTRPKNLVHTHYPLKTSAALQNRYVLTDSGWRWWVCKEKSRIQQVENMG